MIVTVTERQSYKRCRQQWQWGSFNRQGLQPVFTKPALAIGTLWHQTQAEWALQPEADPVLLATKLAALQQMKIEEEYARRVGVPISSSELESFYDGVDLVQHMVANYKSHWGSALPDGFELVAAEQTCLIPVPNTEHSCECDSDPVCQLCNGTGEAPHYLSGTLDGLMRSVDGRVWILERKTYGQRPKREHLDMQDQFLAYLWILDKLGLGTVGGIAYDGAWKRATPPRGSSLPDLFLRIPLTRTRNELINFEQQLTAEVLEMANNPAIYLNRRWDGCWDCAFVTPCIERMKGLDYEYGLDHNYVPRPRDEDSTKDIKMRDE